jgi:hypothetical protein
MRPGHCLTFGPFRLDVTQGRLWWGAQILALRRRSMAMLCSGSSSGRGCCPR